MYKLKIQTLKNLEIMLQKSIITMAIACLLSVAFISFINPYNTCPVYGKTIDNAKNTAITFANVGLYTKDSVLVVGTTSDANGDYCLKNVPDGTYKLIAYTIGYEKKVIAGVLVNSSTNKQIDLRLDVSKLELKTVTIVTTNEQAPAPTIDYDTKETERVSYSYNSNNTRGARSGAASYAWSSGGKKRMLEYNTAEYKKIEDNEFKEAKKNPLSTFSIDVDKASYSNIRRFITQGSLPPADAVRVEEMINYFPYVYPQPENNEPFSITTEYTECPWNSRHNLIHIGLQGKQIKLDKMPPNNLVFLIDVSGSMDEPDRLPLIKSALQLLAEQMREEDKVSIVVYAGNAGLVLPPTSGAHKDRIKDALEKLEAGGSTAGGAGIELAYKTCKENFLPNGNNRVILATDGDFNVGVSSDGELVRMIEKKREDGIFLSALGVGNDNYKDAKLLQLADKGNGNYYYIDNLLEAKKVLVKEMGGTLLTIAKDVKIQIEFNPAKVKAYRLVGYEKRLLNNEDFNDDKKDAGELGSGHTVTAMYEIIPAGSDEEVASIDPLKYQTPAIAPTASYANDVMTIKFRYKEPKEATSKLITKVMLDNKKPFESASENIKFSSAVAEFGMLLRDSKFKGDANYKNIMTLAKTSKGKDDDGYRAEFIQLVEKAELLKK